ncbi:MAG: hypothetical protein R6W90_03855 [Ignavibacteriaceae bacterium]
MGNRAGRTECFRHNWDLHLSLSPKMYLNQSTVLTITGAKAVFLLYSPSEGESVTDYLLGLVGGGGYFFNPQFSIGVEAQLNFSISNENSIRFGNPDKTNINTAAAIYASIYF